MQQGDAGGTARYPRGMSEHRARIVWKSAGDFAKGKYSREHTWTFDGGLNVLASSSPAAVPIPYSNPAGVDPEEAFVASLSSCHMLTFLFVAYRGGFAIEAYEDDAVGMLTKNEKGVPWVSKVILRPAVSYAGDKRPTPAEEQSLHHAAHEQCFISNSVKTEIVVEAPAAPSG
jgi:organic hydroperoxide reductase OsmC/OhrA